MHLLRRRVTTATVNATGASSHVQKHVPVGFSLHLVQLRKQTSADMGQRSKHADPGPHKCLFIGFSRCLGAKWTHQANNRQRHPVACARNNGNER